MSKRASDADAPAAKRHTNSTEANNESIDPTHDDRAQPDSTLMQYDESGLPYVLYGATRRVYHFAQQTEPWYAIRRGLVTATAATTMAGLNRYEHPWDFARVWLGAVEKPVDDAGRDIMEYGNVYEDRNRRLFEHVTGLRVAEAGFVVDTEQPRRGISPDGLVEPARVEIRRGGAGAPLETLDLGMSLFEAKCSPYSLPRDFKVSYVGQVHAQMAVTGLRWCWASLWHQDALRVMLVEFSPDLWAWMDLRIRHFLALCDRHRDDPDAAAAAIRADPLWAADGAQAIEADWYPSRFGDQAFAARHAGNVWDKLDLPCEDNCCAERELAKEIGFVHGETPDCALRRLAPRPVVHEVYAKTDALLDTTTRTDRGYVARSAWPAEPPRLADFAPMAYYATDADAQKSPFMAPVPAKGRYAAVLRCARTGPLPDAILAHQDVYAATKH